MTDRPRARDSSPRGYPRAPLQIAVSYRTSGAFLVAYSTNLSKGGIFIEANPLPVGTEVQIELAVPEVGRLSVRGQVAWTRHTNAGDLPAGMGIKFSRTLDESYGEAIDQLVRTFEGLEIMVMGSIDRRAMIGRYAASILACDTVEADRANVARALLEERVDLALIDLDTAGPDGMEAIQAARSSVPPTPVIAITDDPDARDWAKRQGVDVIVRAPPTFSELQKAVIAALSRAALSPTRK